MNSKNEELQRAMNPLWLFASGLLTSLILVLSSHLILPAPIGPATLVLGILSLVAAPFSGSRRSFLLLFLLSGLLLGLGRGATTNQNIEQRRALFDDPDSALRIRAEVLSGWTSATWGFRNRVRVLSANLKGQKLNLPRICRMEIRGFDPELLPPPGQRFEGLVRLRASAEKPLLLAASAQMLRKIGTPLSFPAWRESLAEHLLRAAGHDVSRIRAAELAAALSLGRRDLLPPERVEAWRRGGAAHVLAVSGLHVGIIAGLFWFSGILLGLRPQNRRWLMIPLIIGYTLLAGAAPSAMRACLMICLYLTARLMGRVVLPMATILSAAVALLLWNPSLLFQAGFQLTVIITAALIRWLPAIVEVLPLPKILGGMLAIPLLAQAVALPLVATHFRMLSPLAGIVNLAVPLFLSPSIPLASAAVLFAGPFPGFSALLLDLISLLISCFQWVATLGRSWIFIPPSPPSAILALFLLSGLLALRYDRFGKRGALSWIFLLLMMPLLWIFRSTPAPNSIELLPIIDGTSVLLNSSDAHILFDGGRYEGEASEQLADAGVRTLDAIVLSHADQDHIGGIARVLECYPTARLLFPRWLFKEARMVPLLRLARRKDCELIPLVRGVDLHVGDLHMETLWPPPDTESMTNNDRSIVLRARWAAGSMLLTGDISRKMDFRLLLRGSVRADLLLIPHHGSRNSTSPALLETVDPSIALIPAGRGNLHHHPHREILRMLSARHIPFRYPAGGGICGARFQDGHWVPIP